MTAYFDPGTPAPSPKIACPHSQLRVTETMIRQKESLATSGFRSVKRDSADLQGNLSEIE
jgi:hypothetical protein